MDLESTFYLAQNRVFGKFLTEYNAAVENCLFEGKPVVKGFYDKMHIQLGPFLETIFGRKLYERLEENYWNNDFNN